MELGERDFKIFREIERLIYSDKEVVSTSISRVRLTRL